MTRLRTKSICKLGFTFEERVNNTRRFKSETELLLVEEDNISGYINIMYRGALINGYYAYAINKSFKKPVAVLNHLKFLKKLTK